MGFLQVIERRIERARDRFFDQAFAQANAQVAGQNLHHVLRLEGRKFFQPSLKQLGLGHGAARFVQILEKSLRFAQRKGLGRGSTFERFEGGFARVAMAARDPAQLGIAAPARAEERAIKDRPSGLQGPLVGLREWLSG